MNLPRTLVIDLGDPASLAALATVERPELVVLWHPVTEDAAADRRRAAVDRHAKWYNVADWVEELVTLPPASPPSGRTPSDESHVGVISFEDGAVVLRAASAATRFGCGRIVWPVHVGPEFDALSRAMEQTTLLAHWIDLARQGSGLPAADRAKPHAGAEEISPSADLVAPILDLSDARIVELLVREDAPLNACWWCRRDGDEPCGECVECARWAAAFHAANAAWPWTRSTAVAA